MRRWLAAVAAGKITVLALYGCGLSVTGVAVDLDPDGTDATVSRPDASSAAPVDAGTGVADAQVEAPLDASDEPEAGDPCSSELCGFEVPEGWSIVLFSRNGATPCPAGFVTESAVTNAAALPGACTCSPTSCTFTSLPSCNEGVVPTTLDYSASPMCHMAGASVSLNKGNCARLDASLGTHARIAAPAPQGARTCTAPAVPNPDAVTTTSVNVCTSASCAAICAEAPASGLERCLMAAGDQTCPADAPNKTLIAARASPACGNCSTCLVTASCSGSMAFYSDGACQNHIVTLQADQCSNGGVSFGSYKWTGIAQVTCAPSGPPAPRIVLEEPRTICCK